MKTDNPFWYNYVFSVSDLKRATISRWEYPLLFFLTTWVQVSNGYAFHFKQFRNRYYLMKVEKI